MAVQIRKLDSTAPDFKQTLSALLAFEAETDDAIVDVVSTGGTLRANNLVEVEKIMDISSRLVVNQAALKLKRERLQPILDAFERASKAKG